MDADQTSLAPFKVAAYSEPRHFSIPDCPVQFGDRQYEDIMAAGMKKLSNTFVWILMGMLIIGLAGFGAVNFTGSVSSVAVVGDQEVSVDDYARELQREQRALEAQTGQRIPIAQMTALGMDRVVLGRLIAIAALDQESSDLGLSIGDQNLFDEISRIPAFQDGTGAFNRDTYQYALDNIGLTEAAFEADLRRESARTLVQGAIMAGTEMPDTLRDTLTSYVGARRSFGRLTVSEDSVALTAVEPSEDQLRAFYDANIDQFTLPRTKVITYAALRPDALVDEIEIDDAALEKLFNDRSAEYQVPERRLVERLVFADRDAADSAKAQLDINGTTFDALVADRGLSLQDVDLGDVTMGDLGSAGQDVFAAQVGEVVGPLDSDLGPALFRVNGRLEARVTILEDVKDELRAELATDRARRLIETRAEEINDMLAGGATLEELIDEPGMELGKVDWHSGSTDGIAAYDGFRQAASAVTAEDFPEVAFLEDGSLFAIRLDEELDPRPEPFEDAQDRLRAAWQTKRLQDALKAEAERLADMLRKGEDLPEGIELTSETGLTRAAYIDAAPQPLMARVFDLAEGEVAVVSDDTATVVVRLTETLPVADTPEMTALAEAMGTQLDQALAQALFEAFVQDAQTRAAPRIDPQALNAVQANFQ
ncbi:putative peptidyl-prolyl cis-trans isomerase D [Phaeobacter piscinae]|uniref:Parvulin-like PPIase n=2 Tax=Phaeobacter piscinae TaxID=1580596 RepID=A0AAN1LAF8_9RHOB|nr:putative peptidyl-prolyl cis-trans isomerase D [Phaeobacter piscinae]AUR35895.1 putative peptidyl-prolyl cis-trans isomerase D [Phaeobacter piscinae]